MLLCRYLDEASFQSQTTKECPPSNSSNSSSSGSGGSADGKCLFPMPATLAQLTPALDSLSGLRHLGIGVGIIGTLPSNWAAPGGLLR